MEQLTACLAFVLACGLRKSSALDTLRLSVAVSIRGKSPSWICWQRSGLVTSILSTSHLETHWAEGIALAPFHLLARVLCDK